MKRRTFLQVGGVAVAGGIEGILRARRAPAFAQPVKIHLFHPPDFIPEGDVELRRQIAEYNKQMKIGYAGPANASAGEVYSKYVITDMFAKGVQGMKPDDAVKWAEGELKKVYES